MHGTSSCSHTLRIVSVRSAGFEAFEVADLAVAEHEDASLAEIFVEPREGETGFLHVGAQDAAIEAAAAGENLEIEAQRFGTALKKFADRHASQRRASLMLAAVGAHARLRDRGARPTPQAAACAPMRPSASAPATCL